MPDTLEPDSSSSATTVQDAPQKQSSQTTPTSPSPFVKETHQDWTDDTLDALMVSSNGVGFYLPAYMLQAHSAVFRDIISGGLTGQTRAQSDPSTKHHTLELTDNSFETSSVVAWVLQLMHGTFDTNTFVEDQKAETILSLTKVKSFANKWDCRSVLDGLERAIITISCDSHTEPFNKLAQFDILTVASNINRPYAAYAVLLHWDAPDSDEKREYRYYETTITKKRPFDVTVLTRFGYSLFSIDYIYALHKSFRQHPMDQKL
ncbi:hypothetical protein L198_02600 [Cryptococcus wingfieldii CBS 7118]|uniref:BTB domain-containing protein n=1 Tax=Cryptococcus wingfieldii CBS 7118 TaxID=1295528 RepID=A0A1E3JPN4_9TREE|nr:hypothetical protein L198_02600 [Cryptococcus wingfieldii CBS 7118]ODO01872.1 hypothetical protein L198_02600 [Cryptococcus wingfieldii CBS 7118]